MAEATEAVTETAERVAKAGKAKVKGVPVAVWAVGLGVVLGLALLARNRSTGAGSATEAGQGFTSAGGTEDTAGNLGPNVLAPAPAEAPAVEAPTDNDGWRLVALARLFGANYNPLAANTALSKWLDGEPLDSTEQAIVTEAMKLAGPPPQAPPMPVGSGTAPPPPAPAPAPPAYQPPPDPAPAPAPSVDPSIANTAAMYLANFTRADYWYGPNADAAKVWLAQHGYTVPQPSRSAARLHYLRTHPELAEAVAAGGDRLRKFLANHPAIANDWAALS